MLLDALYCRCFVSKGGDMSAEVFNDFLFKGPLQKLSRGELLIQLQLYHADFEGLDAVTLSRWMNRKTVPSFEKQILIALATKTQKELLSSYKGYTFSTSKTLDRVYRRYLSEIDSSYWSILDDDQVQVCMTILKWDEYIKLTGKIRNKVPFLKTIQLEKEEKSLNPGLIRFFYILDLEGRLLSFTGVGHDFQCFSNVLEVNEKDLNQSTIGLFSFYRTSKHMQFLTGLLFNYLFLGSNCISHCIPARGKASMQMIEEMKLDFLMVSPGEKNVGNYYYYKKDVHKLLGKSICFQAMLDTNMWYEDLNEKKDDFLKMVFDEA